MYILLTFPLVMRTRKGPRAVSDPSKGSNPTILNQTSIAITFVTDLGSGRHARVDSQDKQLDDPGEMLGGSSTALLQTTKI